MSISIVSKVGLEWEFFVVDAKGNLVSPSTLELLTDDFPIIGEARAAPGDSVGRCIGNFIDSVVSTKRVVEKNKCTMHTGIATMTPAQYAAVVRSAGTKQISTTKNIYRTDILALPEDVRTIDGKEYRLISAGLHIHFSRQAITEYYYNAEHTSLRLEQVSLLNDKAVKRIIRAMDKALFPRFKSAENVRYRQPGYYEEKPWGFEYRSLPMLDAFFDVSTITEVVETSFDLLNK